jgi:Peptidase family M48
MPGRPRPAEAEIPCKCPSSFSVQLKKGECKLFQSRTSFRAPVVPRLFFALCVIAPALLAAAATAAPPVTGQERTRQLQRVLDRVKEQLGLDHAVMVEVVPRNPHLISVEAPARAGGPFVVRVEERMLELLDDGELEAAFAHELGHVWVFTHFPYLQTEQLANEIAMRIVARDVLARVYEKVWKSGAAKGDLSTFTGLEPAAASGTTPGKQQQQ